MASICHPAFSTLSCTRIRAPICCQTAAETVTISQRQRVPKPDGIFQIPVPLEMPVWSTKALHLLNPRRLILCTILQKWYATSMTITQRRRRAVVFVRDMGAWRGHWVKQGCPQIYIMATYNPAVCFLTYLLNPLRCMLAEEVVCAPIDWRTPEYIGPVERR